MGESSCYVNSIHPPAQVIRVTYIYFPRIAQILNKNTERFGEITAQEVDPLKYVVEAQEIISNSNLLCSTCSNCGSKAVTQLVNSVSTVIVDEVTQSIEIEVLLALRFAQHRIVLVGDHKQLAPQVRSRKARTLGLHVSLMERIIQQRYITTVLLNIQYRMHPDIAQLLKDTYEEYTTATNEHQQWQSNFFLLEKSKAVLIQVDYTEDQEIGNTSFYNISQSLAAVRIVLGLLKAEQAHPTDIAILAFYAAHAAATKKVLLEKYTEACNRFTKNNQQPAFILEHLKEIAENRVFTVDPYQGHECKFEILLGCRSGKSKIGFVANANRATVALSRAKDGLFLVCDATTMLQSGSAKWSQVLKHFIDKPDSIFFLKDIQKHKQLNMIKDTTKEEEL